jgi:hypothetical protein
LRGSFFGRRRQLPRAGRAAAWWNSGALAVHCPAILRVAGRWPAGGAPARRSAQRDDNPGMSSLVIGLIVVYAVFFALINLIVTWRAA